ncbi:hypothetical protein UFOVP1290_181 [uncultured Caudovirales phage]|uniref:Uncharacterized protein n=1 Tax=uncultured Caudovirales phage TaxID=2100421 RepID=A0A6J5RSU4_9CAUD|nr:hypothetical protein UFOVP1290_181 [uncultured Caudovirales phage]
MNLTEAERELILNLLESTTWVAGDNTPAERLRRKIAASLEEPDCEIIDERMKQLSRVANIERAGTTPLKVNLEYFDGVFYALVSGTIRGSGTSATLALNEAINVETSQVKAKIAKLRACATEADFLEKELGK